MDHPSIGVFSSKPGAYFSPIILPSYITSTALVKAGFPFVVAFIAFSIAVFSRTMLIPGEMVSVVLSPYGHGILSWLTADISGRSKC
jgi:hypothetical protein